MIAEVIRKSRSTITTPHNGKKNASFISHLAKFGKRSLYLNYINTDNSLLAISKTIREINVS